MLREGISQLLPEILKLVGFQLLIGFGSVQSSLVAILVYTLRHVAVGVDLEIEQPF